MDAGARFVLGLLLTLRNTGKSKRENAFFPPLAMDPERMDELTEARDGIGERAEVKERGVDGGEVTVRLEVVDVAVISWVVAELDAERFMGPGADVLKALFFSAGREGCCWFLEDRDGDDECEVRRRGFRSSGSLYVARSPFSPYLPWACARPRYGVRDMCNPMAISVGEGGDRAPGG